MCFKERQLFEDMTKKPDLDNDLGRSTEVPYELKCEGSEGLTSKDQ